MKRQRNTQQVKQHEKCPPNQTKEEEIGNLPEKEFRIMIIKMIQNLENKMELQINSLETKIEKMQEMFNTTVQKHQFFSPPGCPVLGTSQARMLDRVAISFFPTQRWSPGLLHFMCILYHLSHQGRPIRLYMDYIDCT